MLVKRLVGSMPQPPSNIAYQSVACALAGNRCFAGKTDSSTTPATGQIEVTLTSSGAIEKVLKRADSASAYTLPSKLVAGRDRLYVVYQASGQPDLEFVVFDANSGAEISKVRIPGSQVRDLTISESANQAWINARSSNATNSLVLVDMATNAVRGSIDAGLSYNNTSVIIPGTTRLLAVEVNPNPSNPTNPIIRIVDGQSLQTVQSSSFAAAAGSSSVVPVAMCAESNGSKGWMLIRFTKQGGDTFSVLEINFSGGTIAGYGALVEYDPAIDMRFSAGNWPETIKCLI